MTYPNQLGSIRTVSGPRTDDSSAAMAVKVTPNGSFSVAVRDILDFSSGQIDVDKDGTDDADWKTLIEINSLGRRMCCFELKNEDAEGQHALTGFRIQLQHTNGLWYSYVGGTDFSAPAPAVEFVFGSGTDLPHLLGVGKIARAHVTLGRTAKVRLQAIVALDSAPTVVSVVGTIGER